MAGAKADKGAPLRLAIIGAGVMGRNYLRAAKAAGIPIAFITDANPDAAAQAAAEYGCTVIANPKPSDMDAAVIAVPTAHHAAVALPLLKANVHCLVEKPFVTNADEGKALIAAAHNAILQVGHIERFNPAVEALMACKIDPSRITAFSARRTGPASARVTDVSVVIDLMVHDLDVIKALKPVDVFDISVSGTADEAQAKLHFVDGATAILTASRIVQDRVRTLDIVTKDSAYHLDYIAKSLLTDVASAQNKAQVYTGDALGAELAHFIACIQSTTRPRVTGKAALAVMDLTWRIEAALGKTA